MTENTPSNTWDAAMVGAFVGVGACIITHLIPVSGYESIHEWMHSSVLEALAITPNKIASYPEDLTGADLYIYMLGWGIFAAIGAAIGALAAFLGNESASPDATSAEAADACQNADALADQAAKQSNGESTTFRSLDVLAAEYRQQRIRLAFLRERYEQINDRSVSDLLDRIDDEQMLFEIEESIDIAAGDPDVVPDLDHRLVELSAIIKRIVHSLGKAQQTQVDSVVHRDGTEDEDSR